MLKSLFYAAVCALRAYHYYRIISNPACAALKIGDFGMAFLLDAVFLSCLWLLLFRFDDVRDVLEVSMSVYPHLLRGSMTGFLWMACAGWTFSTYATHATCYLKIHEMRQAAEAKAKAASAAAYAASAASAAPAAVLCPPSTPASAGQKVHTH